MKRVESLCNRPNPVNVTKVPPPGGRRFEQVFDGRKQRARGLWMRDGNYYGRFSAMDPSGRSRDPFRLLTGTATVPSAKAELRRLCDEASKTTISAELAKSELSPRTMNLYVIALRNVLKRAQEEGLIRELPMMGLRALRVDQPKRELLPIEHFERVLAVAAETRRNGAEFCDYYRLLLFTGARER